MNPESSNPRSVTSLLPTLLRGIGALRCSFFEIPLPPPFEARVADNPTAIEIAGLARTQKRINDSFIDTFLEIAAEKGVSESLIPAVCFHQPLSRARRIDVEVEDLTSQSIVDLRASIAEDSILTFSSLIHTSDGAVHLPMLDFKLERDLANDRVAHEVKRFIGGGSLLSSGSSYHYYGNTTLAQAEFERWLLNCQLLSRYVDVRWITHQLMEGQAALRVSSHSPSREPTLLEERL